MMENKIIIICEQIEGGMHIGIEAEHEISFEEAASIMHIGITETMKHGISKENILRTIFEQF